MKAYEFYYPDSIKGYELLGILPERRRDPQRITDASVMNWGKMLLADNRSEESIFYDTVTISEYTGRFFRVIPSEILIQN